MNGSRSRSSESPTLGQHQQRNYYPPYVGTDEFAQNPQGSQQQYLNQSYDVSKQPSLPPRMSNVALGQQQPAHIYGAPQPNMNSSSSYCMPNQMTMNGRPQRFQTQTNQQMGWTSQPMMLMNTAASYSGQQPILINQPLIPRLTNPTFPANITSTHPTWSQAMPHQPHSFPPQCYGNPTVYFTGQPRGAPPTGPSNITHPRPEKRHKNILPIVNPNTGMNVLEEYHHVTSVPQESSSKSVPVAPEHPSVANSPPHNEIAAQFAAQVAATLTAPKEDTYPSQPVVNSFHSTPVSNDQALVLKQCVTPETSVPQSIHPPPPIIQKNGFVSTTLEEDTLSDLIGDQAVVMGSKPAEIHDSCEIVAMNSLENVVTEPQNSKDVNIVSQTASISSDGTSESCNIVNVGSTEVTLEHMIPVPQVDIGTVRELETEIQKPEPTQKLEISGTKKERVKRKAKDINKKGDHLLGSEFDAYTDDKVKTEEGQKPTLPDTSTKTPEIVEPHAEKAEPEQPPPQTQTQPTPIVSPAPALPGEIVVVPHQESPESIYTPDNDGIPKVETEDVGNDSLEEGEIVDDDEEEGMELRYKYTEAQWSPLNPEGKKHYDREFLLQLQFDRQATSKPAGLPNIPDIVLDKPVMGRQYSCPVSVGSMGSQDFDFTPKYIYTPSGGSKSRGVSRQLSHQKNKGSNYQQQRTINVSIHKDIELHKAKKAWKPGRVESKDTEVEDTAAEELYKKTRSILNKLTPQKFETLITQMQDLPIDKEYKLIGVIALVFEKAISEPSFSVAYANMCRCLSMFKVPSDSKDGEVNFRTLLLTRCQHEFETGKFSEALFVTKREEIEKHEEGPKKEELKAELEDEQTKAKRRFLGNIRFIGELFKLKMLTENIMHDCLLKLLRSKDEENFECLCRLLTTVGKELDTDKAKARMDQYFHQMARIVGEKKTSSRVRFMLQDVIDLRTGKWKPRRNDNNPKTIDQIHKEMEQEAQEKAFQSQNSQIQQKSSRGGRRGPPDQRGGGGGGSDGWNTVGGGRTSLKSVDRSIDPSRMKFSKQNVDESVQLGPGGGAAGRFSGWGRGSTGGTTGRPSQEKEQSNVPANRYSALGKPEEGSNRRYGASSPARGDARGRGGYGHPPLNVRHSHELEREKAISAAKAIGASQSVERVGGSRDRSRGHTPYSPLVSQEVRAHKVLTFDEMVKKTKAILDEYLQLQDVKEAVECVKELSELNHHHFVNISINNVLERSTQARQQTGSLLHDLVKGRLISIENYIKGLTDVLKNTEDMEIDIPMIWQYYGELISPMIQDGCIPLISLKQAAQPLIPNNKAGILLAEILHDASNREGHKKVAVLWKESGLQWSDFVPKNQVEQFIVEKKLEFTTEANSVPTTPTTGVPLDEIASNLHMLIVEQNADNESVFDWIETNIDDVTTKQPKFIRALMTAVCTSAIEGERGKQKLNKYNLNARNNLLQKYLDHKAESELHALYALQALITKLEHPQGVLRELFDFFYDEDIISEDAFFQWERSSEEPEGKGAAIQQSSQFFNWLHEAETGS